MPVFHTKTIEGILEPVAQQVRPTVAAVTSASVCVCVCVCVRRQLIHGLLLCLAAA